MFEIITANLGTYTAFRYRDCFVSIEGYKVVLCSADWHSQERYDLSALSCASRSNLKEDFVE